MSGLFTKSNTSSAFKSTMLLSAILGVLVHGVLVLYFYFTAIPEMIFYNILSVLFFGTMYFILRKTDRAILVFTLESIEVVIHTFLAIYFIGIDSGFVYFMLIIPPIFLLNPYWKLWYIGFFLMLIGVLFFLCFEFAKVHQQIYTIDFTLEYYTRIVCITLDVIIILALFLVNGYILENNERALKRSNRKLNKQFKKLEILLKEIHHRVKNNLQVIYSLINLQKNQAKNAKVVKILEDSQTRIASIALIHKKLYQGDNLEGVNFEDYLKELLTSQELIGEVQCSLDAIKVEINLDIAVPLGLMTSELIINAIKHAYVNLKTEDRRLDVILIESAPDEYVLTIKDNGIGLPKDFDIKNPTSLGMEIIDTLAEQINATVSYSSSNKGTEFNIDFKK